MSNNGGFCEKHSGFERGSIREDNEKTMKRHKMFEGKPKYLKKKRPNCAKHAIFATELSRMQVARVSHETL